MSDEELIKFLRKQIEAEESIVESADKALKDIDNIPVNSALKGIAMDSNKHADMYRSAISLLEGGSMPLQEQDLDLQRETISRHIEMEEQLISELEDIIPGVDDPKVSLLLNAIMADERKHHKLLKRIADVLVRGETITEHDWWEAVWKDVPGLWI
ncbi:MAG: ferritin-like domain-containing protein [Candidatus Bathyarchaeia archaeon]